MDIPALGNLVLCLSLIAAAYACSTALVAGRSGTQRWLFSARYGTYATCALITVAVLLLAYAFQTHDFRIRYVARYSDRSMGWAYLLTSLWGGQDGSMLWWSFLLCGYTAAVTFSFGRRYVELQPYVLFTLMSILIFFIVVMLFAANPFALMLADTPQDGEGLNPLLQNYWMTIHPPSLYLGFVGWSVPFAFGIAALITGRLDEEWLLAARKWALLAWLFLSIGLLLGMLWSYEELGWGGYWAWDPVENASFHPWLVGTAYLHSVMVQERYRMLKTWNIALLCLTFFMTIFGTFLTRSGLIASVHSFARSDIGIFFVWYLVFLAAACIGLIVWRLPKLRAVHRIEALMSREFAFLLNNWILLGMMVFVLIATTFPLLSEWLRGEQVTVGPSFYNRWMVPFALVLLFLMGVGPLMAWRRATGKKLTRALRAPMLSAGIVGLLHLLIGPRLGFPALIAGDALYATATGQVLDLFTRAAPLISTTCCAAVLGTIVQEFWRGMAARMRSQKESPGLALMRLVGRAKRRYGGYTVHAGITLMYLGFTGAAYDVEKEAALSPGEMMRIEGYRIRYEKPRMEVDPNKRMVFTDLTVMNDQGRVLGQVSPAKFIYRTHPQMPTTEVAKRVSSIEDLYVIMSTVDPQTKRATFRVIVRPLVVWIWIGGLVLILGAFIAMSPSVRELLGESAFAPMPMRASPVSMIWPLLLLLCGAAWLSPQPLSAQSDSSSSLHAGTVVMHNADERRLFSRLLCQCGECARLPMDGCGCNWATQKREKIRAEMAAGRSVDDIIASYREEFGPKAIAVPSDRGLDRALWAIPVAGTLLAALALIMLGRRWARRSAKSQGEPALMSQESAIEASPDERQRYDALLDDELSKFEGGDK